MTINDNSTKSINAAIIDLQNQIKQLQHKIDILNKNQLKEDDIEFPGKVEYADEAGKAKEADHAKTADTADTATKAIQDGNGNVITSTYAKKSEVNNLIDDSKTDSARTWSSEKISKSKVAFSSEEKEIGTWFGQKLYEKTVILDVPKNGGYIASIPSNEKIKDWRGNFFQGSIDNPDWIMHAPYTYIEDDVSWIMIYIYFASGMIQFTLRGGGSYTNAYFNGQLVLTYKYTKD